nr:putative sodium-coupled neutral amino acid transporter 10 isoform X1 [Biomphalaria glabrata]
MGLHNNIPLIINMGNSIIGVAVLAMPYCFQQCGIILGMLLLLFCTWLTLLSCKLLMKAGITARRRSYEFLAYHTHGAPGKFITEIGMIGMQFGTLIAQMVIIGDLGPSIVTKLFGLANFSGMRTILIITLGLSIGLPMGLLKDLRAISKASTVCIICYSVYVFYVIVQSLPDLVKGDWITDVTLWRTKGLFRCLPIFSFSFGCQSQLFILYDALPEPSLKVISSVTNSAVNLCAAVYLIVGFLGYISYHTYDIPGDIMNIFPITPGTDATKMAFVISTVITFPVIIYPCRSSIYTLFFAKPIDSTVSSHPLYTKQDSETEEVPTKSKHHDDFLAPNSHMPERLFKMITVGIVLSSMVLSLLIPNVEIVLGINGAIMGTLICYIFPALFYLKVMGSSPEDKNKAQFLLFAGITILLVSTMATLSPLEPQHGHHHHRDLPELLPNRATLSPLNQNEVLAPDTPPPLVNNDVQANDGRRKEPPNPDPPDKVVEVKQKADVGSQQIAAQDQVVKKVEDDKSQEEAIRAKELEKEKKQDDLIAKLEQHRVEQEKLIEEQKQLIQQFKLHHQKDMEDKNHQINQPQDGQLQANQQQPFQDQGHAPQDIVHHNNLLQADPQGARLSQGDTNENKQHFNLDSPAAPHGDLLAAKPANSALNAQNDKAPMGTDAPLLQNPPQNLVNQPQEPIQPQVDKLSDFGSEDLHRLKRDTNQTLKESVKLNQGAEAAPLNSSADKSQADAVPLQKAIDNNNAAPTQKVVETESGRSTKPANQLVDVHTVKVTSKNPEMRRKLRSLGIM